MSRAQAGVEVVIGACDDTDASETPEADEIKLHVSVQKDDLINAIDEMARGQYKPEEYLRERANFTADFYVVD